MKLKCAIAFVTIALVLGHSALAGPVCGGLDDEMFRPGQFEDPTGFSRNDLSRDSLVGLIRASIFKAVEPVTQDSHAYPEELIIQVAKAISSPKLGLSSEISNLIKIHGRFEISRISDAIALNWRRQRANEIRQAEESFEFAKAKILELVGRLPSRQLDKDMLLSKVNKVVFAGTNCGGFSTLFSLSLERRDSIYSEGTQSVRMCDGSFLRSTSQFKQIFTFGHEICHSIDPCNLWRSHRVPEGQHPFQGQLNQLRDDGLAARAPGSRLTHRSQVETERVLCEDDQMPESFCDWVGTEVLAEWIFESQGTWTVDQIRTGVANVLRPMTGHELDSSFVNRDHGLTFERHLDVGTRLNRILLGNSRIRKGLICD